MGDRDYDEEDDDELERVEDFEDENERHRKQQRQQQQRQAQRRESRPQQPRLDEVQAAEDRLAALELRLDSAENNLLLDEDDPFAAELAEPRRRPQQQQRRRQRDDYGDEDQEDDLLAEQHQRTLDERGRGRPNRRELVDDDDGGENYSRTLKNLGDGLATLQDKRDRARHGARHQTQDVHLEDVDEEEDARELQNSSSRGDAQRRERARPRDDSGGSQSENVPADHHE